MTLFEKSVEVAYSKEAQQKGEAEFNFESKNYAMIIVEKCAKTIAYVVDTKAKEIVKAIELTNSEFKGHPCN